MADTKSLVLLGSTGSIGVQALEVAQGAGYRVAAPPPAAGWSLLRNRFAGTGRRRRPCLTRRQRPT